MELKVDSRAKVSAAFAEGTGSIVVGPVGEVVGGAVGVGDGVSENGEAGMNMPVGMEV